MVEVFRSYVVDAGILGFSMPALQNPTPYLKNVLVLDVALEKKFIHFIICCDS